MPASTTPKAPVSIQKPLVFNTAQHIRLMVHGIKPYYTTNYGAAYLSDSRELLRKILLSPLLICSSPLRPTHSTSRRNTATSKKKTMWSGS